MRKMKCTTEDYTEKDFPATRKDVFFECYREHFSLLFRIGCMCLVFLIPVLLLVMMRDLYIITAISGLKEQTVENIATVYYWADMVFGLFQVLAITLFAVLFAGVAQIIRQICWNVPVFFGDDLKKGIKSNALRFGFTAFVIASISYILNLFTASIIVYILFAVFAVFILPVAIWFVLQGLYYKLGVSASVKNALLLYLRTVPYTILLIVCSVVPFWLVMNTITLLIVKYLIFIALALFYMVPITLCWILYALHIFDKYINKQHYPEIYRKGMRRETEAEKKEGLF